jgi:hypothetical protein
LSSSIIKIFSLFLLHTFSIAEKVCKKARQKGASTLKANAGPHFCQPNARQITSICILVRDCEVRSNLSDIFAIVGILM